MYHHYYNKDISLKLQLPSLILHKILAYAL